MTLEKLVLNYIASAEQALDELKIIEAASHLSKELIMSVVDLAKDYLHDAKYYREEKKFEISLASVAYCEGLLDALRILKLVKFEWRKPGENVKEK
ncbi:MAG: DUF357 domain-containing protein [Candidatus Bathyarchaeota archaeon]|nr:DUF357 domain-containing protein [Candidatus Bathyarchaeota archaeon]MCX8177466.1 DUF357 domain-containing protein [Candidatus Bathyarchaeota archaeon]MDW8194133.1 DUF357 domain-containing protein [Nitrososphaerota archaeon]